MRLIPSILFVFAALICLTAAARAGEKAGVRMPDQLQVAGKSLRLNGMGLHEATWLSIDVYVAGLYLEGTSSDASAILSSRQVKRLVLRFVRDVDRDDIVDTCRDGFRGNATVKLASIQAQIDQVIGWMRDFQEGDVLQFTATPGEGVAVDINGVRKGLIQNEDFARSLFAIWLGPKPPTSDVKAGLLGKR